MFRPDWPNFLKLGPAAHANIRQIVNQLLSAVAESRMSSQFAIAYQPSDGFRVEVGLIPSAITTLCGNIDANVWYETPWMACL